MAYDRDEVKRLEREIELESGNKFVGNTVGRRSQATDRTIRYSCELDRFIYEDDGQPVPAIIEKQFRDFAFTKFKCGKLSELTMGRVTMMLAELVEALEKIEQNDSSCECDDHTQPECCANVPVTDCFCAHCIAGKALL
jgi:hypothetical protein